MLPVILDYVHFKGGTLLLLAYGDNEPSCIGGQFCPQHFYTHHPLSLKTIFFDELHATESWKMVERLVNYVIYKGTFLPLVGPPTLVRAGLWSTWLIVLCSLKMFQALARDQLERLNASPSATPWTYFRSEDTVKKAASVVTEFSLDVEEIITEENNNGEDVTEKAGEADVNVVEDLDLDLDSRQPDAGDVNIEEDMDLDTSGQSLDIVNVTEQQNEEEEDEHRKINKKNE
ncbi:unnamed protein product [Lactuca saligna]|uniref:Uncharacterized protein n=1 Tax=Lactuca saligna TaxID=75948 RepID=A0AA36ELD4_LACSI|nr:unnamed protein product [Lactuca saligna]